MQTTATAYTDGHTRHQARRGLAIYFAIVVALSAPIQAVIIGTRPEGSIAWLTLLAPLMFVPTIASVVARLVLKEGFSDVSFRFGGRRGRNTILLALILPVVVGLVANGIAWSTGLVGFRLPPMGLWVTLLGVFIVLNLVLVSGEEIGWRGYMLTRLIDAGVPRPVLASALIWGLWHVPLFLWGGFVEGVPPLLATALLMVMAPSLGYVLARMRLETGSVWPAIALHVAWNVIIQTGFHPLTAGASKQLWVGESGLLTALVVVVVAVIYSRRGLTIIRTLPRGEEAFARQAGVGARPRVQ
jgi:membrane protease YdiL (CAAX protease family)